MAEADKSSLIKIQSGNNLTENGESVSNQRENFTDGDESVSNQRENFTDGDESVSVRRDIEFCELYFKVIDKQLSRGNYEENIKEAENYFAEVRSWVDKWCRFKKGNDLEQMNLLKQSFYYRMMCIYFNATCSSSAVAHYFGNFLSQNPKVFKKLLNKSVLRICSVGGGMPSDIVALIKVLASSIYMKDDVQIHVTIIDVDKRWKKPCIAILQSMEKFSKEKWKIDFITLDPLSPSVSPKVESAIKKADFALLFKFLTQMEGLDTEIKRKLFHKLSYLVSPGSILFLMDDATIEVMQVFQGYLGSLRGHNLLFEVAYKLHTLQLPAVKRHYDLYLKHLISIGICNTSFELFCRAWVRTDDTFLHTGDHLESFDPQIKMAEKSLDEKKAWHSQMRLLCRQLGNDKTPDDWKDCFVTEMRNQGCRKKRIQRILNAAEKDLHLRKTYAKQLMFASYQDFLEEVRELRDDRKESDKALKDGKRIDFYKMKRRAEFEQQTYESCVQNLLQHLERNRSMKTEPIKALEQY